MEVGLYSNILFYGNINSSLSALGNIRYDIETDMIQIYNGSEWVDWGSGKQNDLICFPTSDNNVIFGKHPNTDLISTSISIDSFKISSSKAAGGQTAACYLKAANGSSVDLSLYRKLVIDATVTNTSSDTRQYAAVCWLKTLSTNEYNLIIDAEILEKISGNIVGKEFDISNINSGYLGIYVRKENDTTTLSVNCTKFTLVK